MLRKPAPRLYSFARISSFSPLLSCACSSESSSLRGASGRLLSMRASSISYAHRRSSSGERVRVSEPTIHEPMSGRNSAERFNLQ